MRLAELHLRAFGHFTDVRVDLDGGGPALHVLYGHNEAGKSTTLRALTGLFFGIPTRTLDAHRHPMPKLRIGARLIGEDGAIHDVVRKKGKKNTLLGPDDEPIDESVMRQLLAHVGAEQFEVMFGLDHVSLREGATALLSSGGDVGESLYGASLGGSIHDVITKLDEEAKALFAARGRNPELNVAISEYDKAKVRLRDAGFTPEAYKTQLAALDEARRDLATMRARRSDLHSERGRVGRAVRVMPSLAKLARLVADREALPEHGSLSNVRADDLDALKHDHHVLMKSDRDLPNREAARDDAVARALTILGDLGAEPDLDAGRALLPSASDREALRRLIEQHGELVSNVDNAAESLDEKGAERALLEGSGGDDASPGADLTAVEAALADARPLANAKGKLAGLEAEADELASVAERHAASLAGFGGGAEAAAALALPDQESIERDAEARRARTHEVRDAEELAKEARRRLDAIESAISADDRRGSVPSEADLEKERRGRDRLWAALRRSMEGAEDESALSLDAVDPDGYEDAVTHADECADVMRREADRVAQRAQRDLERAEAEREIERVDGRVLAAREALSSHDAATRERWSAIGVEAPDAQAMRQWLSRHRELLRAYEAVEAKRTERAALAARVETAAAALKSALASEAEDLGVLIQTAATLVEEARERRANEKSRREQQRAIESQIVRLEKRLASRRSALDAWNEDWASRVSALRLAPDVPPRQVSEVLESLNELEKAVSAVDDEQSRIDKMNEDAKRFEDEVDALIRAHATDLAELPLVERGAALIDRVDAAHGRIEEAKRLAVEIESLREEVLDAGDGKSIEELSADTDDLDLGQQRGREANIEDEIEELDEEVRAADRNLTTLELGVERFRERTSAAEAADDAEEVLARVRDAAHRYIRLRLAREVLRAEIARFREENQGPILQKANALFPRLTRGAYVALKVVTGDTDEPVLSCVRDGGEEVGVEALSDGTKDQLYLALRLATLLHFAEHNAPLPLILDDCLVHFDDDRARAALEVLGEVSASFQILFFTHHRRLVELAQEAVASDRLRVSDLGAMRATVEARA